MSEIPLYFVCAHDRARTRAMRDECYGCGLCADLCPEECITMNPRR